MRRTEDTLQQPASYVSCTLLLTWRAGPAESRTPSPLRLERQGAHAPLRAARGMRARG